MKIFNPDGSDLKQDRRIFGGNSTNVINLNNVKYGWATQLFVQMQQNFWIPESVDLTNDIKDYVVLTKEERRAYNGILSYLTFLDSIQVTNLPNFMDRITAPEVKMCIGMQLQQECFDSQTEILTELRGFVKFDDLTSEDKVAQYDIETEEITFVQPNSYIKRPFKGKLRHYSSNQTDIMVTENHEMINIHPVTKVASKRLAKNTIGGNYKYPVNGLFPATGKDISWEDYLLVALSADFTIRKLTNGYHAQGTIAKQRKQDRIEFILTNLGIEYTKSLKKDQNSKYLNQYRYSFYIPFDYTNDELKDYDWLNLREYDYDSARELLSEILFWDGTQNRFWYSTNLKALEKVQELGLIAGYSTTRHLNRSAEEISVRVLPSGKLPKTCKDCWVLGFSDKSTITYPKTINSVDYDGYVYCVSVEKQNIVTRRNYKVAITGNCIHAKSYQVVIESLIPPEERNKVYDYWREDTILKERCEYIASLFQQYEDEKSKKNYGIALFADYLLEGLYFYSGFQFFFNLSSRNLMQGTADMVVLIARDELSHVRLFQKMIPDVVEYTGLTIDTMMEMMDFAAQQEIKWATHIVHDSVLGFSHKAIIGYVKWLANSRLGALGLPKLYDDATENPLKHLDLIADVSKDAGTKSNFFETRVTSYSMSTALDGWENF